VKNPFPIFGVLAMVGIGISMLQMFVKDISLIIAIMWGSTVNSSYHLRCPLQNGLWRAL